jgi:hypothetical protein
MRRSACNASGSTPDGTGFEAAGDGVSAAAAAFRGAAAANAKPRPPKAKTDILMA